MKPVWIAVALLITLGAYGAVRAQPQRVESNQSDPPTMTQLLQRGPRPAPRNRAIDGCGDARAASPRTAADAGSANGHARPPGSGGSFEAARHPAESRELDERDQAC